MNQGCASHQSDRTVFLRNATLSVLAACLLLAAAGTAQGAEKATVTLTLTKTPNEAKQKLGDNLLSLIELQLQTDPSLMIVERREIDAVIQEHLLDRSQQRDAQLQLGKLLTADLLVMLEFLPADKDNQRKAQPKTDRPLGRLRVVDAKRGAIRGVTVAEIDEATLEDAAAELANYVAAVIHGPEKPVVSVAVTAFENRGRFDRLRPLELGIRDLITARLLQLSGASSTDGRQPARRTAKSAKAEPQPLKFHVLQRSSLEQLLAELALIQSGFSDKEALPKELPSRGAVYLVRGEIDARQADDKYTLIVRGEMVNAPTQRVVEVFQFECPAGELEKRLAVEVDRLGGALSKDAQITKPMRVSGNFEVAMLQDQTLADLRRFHRLDGRTKERPHFRLPGQQPFVNVSRPVETRSLLGTHLLKKAVDRLESILFIQPGDAVAAYALGYCYSVNEPEFYEPDRAYELFRKVFDLEKETELAALAMEYLSQIDYDDATGDLIKGRDATANDRMWFAFVNTPDKFRRFQEYRYLNSINLLHTRPDQAAELADYMTKAASYAEKAPEDRKKPLAAYVQMMATKVLSLARKQPQPTAAAKELLQRWATSDDTELAFWGRKGLAIAGGLDNPHDPAIAGQAHEAAAAAIKNLDDSVQRDRHDMELIEAARLYRTGRDPDRALKLLKSFNVRVPTDNAVRPANNLIGSREYEIGQCYEALGNPQEALAAYLRGATLNPTITGHTDILACIQRLGGVPLDPARDVDVKYFPDGALPRAAGGCLASDGQRIFIAYQIDPQFSTARNGPTGQVAGAGVRVFDPASGSWQAIAFPRPEATCLAATGGRVFAGSDDGLWQFDPSRNQWDRVCPVEKLPDAHVVSLALDGGVIYAGVGSKASGGLMRIDSGRNVRVFDTPGCPAVAPERIVVAGGHVLVSTAEGIDDWSTAEDKWQRKELSPIWRKAPPQLFAGTSTIWASRHGLELADWQADDEANARFRKAWYLPENNQGYIVNFTAGGVLMRFFAQRGDEVWYGGNPWVPYSNSGLYRFNLKTGQFHRFAPADGFAAERWHAIYDGLWLGDRLWLATRVGLCRVEPRAGR